MVILTRCAESACARWRSMSATLLLQTQSYMAASVRRSAQTWTRRAPPPRRRTSAVMCNAQRRRSTVVAAHPCARAPGAAPTAKRPHKLWL